MKKRNIFIGIALPYANGSLHLGHVAGFLGGDILARYHRLIGDNVLLVSGSDCYGTPIAVEAAERGVQPEEIVNKYHDEFRENLINGLQFSYDIYTKTATESHAKVVQEIFLDLYNKGYLYTKTEKALYSPFLERFLPDRFVEGTCPKCKYPDARGDQCDQCGSFLDGTDLIKPRINSKILQRDVKDEDLRLEFRESEHFYLKLSALEEKLQKFIEEKSGLWRANARGFAKSFIKQGLKDRAITRDTGWGIPIPLPGYEKKRIYVWFEAVIGYLSASKLWAKEKGDKDEWKDYWLNKDARHYYVHGKDNIPFHTIIWPAILLAEGRLNVPDYIFSSEYLTFEGKQFSKSRGWGVWLPSFLESFNPETIRFYLTVSGLETSDTDFIWKDYAHLVNSELIGKFGNLVHRALSFSKKNFPEGVEVTSSLDKDAKDLLELTKKAFPKVGKLIEEGKFRSAWLEIKRILEHGNRFVDKKEPWSKIKDEEKREEVQTDLAVIVHVIRSLGILVSPFLPTASKKIKKFLSCKEEDVWEYPSFSKKIKIERVEILYQRIEEEEIEKQYELLERSCS